ncbi:hypothetical protein ACFW08_38290 [Streptomyces sp. NPDC058960]|uniref:hypothetical protein n=1 Tax=Streptomyces sp. NPDC058960 TaxID=3346679 RepID=UPI00367A6001
METPIERVSAPPRDRGYEALKATEAQQLIFREFLTRIYDDGTPIGVEMSTTRPRQVVVIGSLREFTHNGAVKPEKINSFIDPGRRDHHVRRALPASVLHHRRSLGRPSVGLGGVCETTAYSLA